MVKIKLIPRYVRNVLVNCPFQYLKIKSPIAVFLIDLTDKIYPKFTVNQPKSHCQLFPYPFIFIFILFFKTFFLLLLRLLKPTIFPSPGLSLRCLSVPVTTTTGYGTTRSFLKLTDNVYRPRRLATSLPYSIHQDWFSSFAVQAQAVLLRRHHHHPVSRRP